MKDGVKLLENLEHLYMLPARIRIAAILRKAILAGEFKAGQELSLTSIAEQLNVSRTPVREAFQILASEELLELRMNKGAVVKCINSDFISDHYEMRILLECEAVKKFIEKDRDISYLEKIHRNICEKEYFSIEEYKTYNQNFHVNIWESSGNQKLKSMLMSLWNGPSYGRTVSERSHVKSSLEEHEEILKFLKMKDVDSACEFMRTHLLHSMNNLLDSYNLQK